MLSENQQSGPSATQLLVDQLTLTFQPSTHQMSSLFLSNIALIGHISHMVNCVILIKSEILYNGIFRMYIHMCLIHLQCIYYLRVVVSVHMFVLIFRNFVIMFDCLVILLHKFDCSKTYSKIVLTQIILFTP